MKFSKFRHLLLVIGMAGFASPALAQDEERQSCEPAYAVDLAEVAAGVRAKLVADTFKGLARVGDIRLGPDNMPSSEDGRGLIRDGQGKLVFA